MLALRRAANPLRNQGYRLGASRVCTDKLDIQSDDLKHVVPSRFYTQLIRGECRQVLRGSHPNPSYHANFSLGRSLSSQVGANSSGEDDDLEDGFSELEAPETVEESNAGEDDVQELVSDPELSDDDAGEDSVEESQDGTKSSSIEEDKDSEDAPKGNVSLELFKVIVAASPQTLRVALDNWIKDGKSLGRSEISLTMLHLRKRRMYGKALQFSEWLKENNNLTFTFAERDYASRLDLIAKVRGLQQAEMYITKIPESLRGEVIYRTLLANCVVALNAKKAEQVFNKMRDMELPITSFACNQMLLLYKKLDKKKIADVLLMMEKENIKPSLFTYKLLIDTKGQYNDIPAMEQLVDTMKAEGFELDHHIQSMIARHYINGGFKDKAEAILKEMEGKNLKDNRQACHALLLHYAGLGKADEVERIWKTCESNPRVDECLTAIEAWGKLGRIEDAEAVFEKLVKTWKKPSSRCYTKLLDVYANHKLLAKGKDLAKRMIASRGEGYHVDTYTLDSLIRLYVQAGEVEKAESVLQKVSEQQQKMNAKTRPQFNSYMVILDQYARRGDIHSAEKIFHKCRLSGYTGRLRMYQTLLRAYVNAKAPAYGFMERMKADNIFPNKIVAGQLAQVDAFKKTPISDLID